MSEMTNIIQPSRHSFITGLTSLIVAPAIVRVESLMPVKVIEFNELLINNYFNKEAYEVAILDLLKYGQCWTRFYDCEIKIIPLTDVYENKI